MMTPTDFHPRARQIKFTGGHCDELQQCIAQHSSTQPCTDVTPCGFHRTLAEALASAYKRGRESAGTDAGEGCRSVGSGSPTS
jgi:hypothetical protein